jgi:NOL1/NOP2/fmu family ribosome biogenesis protein
MTRQNDGIKMGDFKNDGIEWETTKTTASNGILQS